MAKLEKSELSIHLANEMDKMDRTWNWFIDPFFRKCLQIFLDLSGPGREKVRIMIRLTCKGIYYLVIATVAYITTRDQGDYYAESDWSNIETHVAPAYYYKWVWFNIVFLVMLM